MERSLGTPPHSCQGGGPSPSSHPWGLTSPGGQGGGMMEGQQEEEEEELAGASPTLEYPMVAMGVTELQ